MNIKAVASFDKKYPDYQIGQYCEGSFTNSALKEYLITATSPLSPKKITFFLLLNTRDGNFQVKYFGKKKYDDTDPYIDSDGKSNIILCQDSEYTRWLLLNSKEEDWQYRPSSQVLDSFCVSRDDTHYEYTCYIYENKKKQFYLLYGTYYPAD